jgi:general stress protein CsbA
MLAVLTIGLVFGLVGFAFHTLWIVSIIVLALGLGYVVANVRQDRREVIERD